LTQPVVELVTPGPRHERDFLESVSQSVDLHRGWVHPPSDSEAYALYLQRISTAGQVGFLAVDVRSRGLVGVVNINDIRRGAMLSASLGYYGFAAGCGEGRMTEAVRLAVDHGFFDLGLHRLEANIQPTNTPSVALVKRLGFRLEGFSPRYLYVAGAWRDHERWAVLSEDWRT
jgi:[ribosomal protein S5]-alanine N-acetyltransferase